MKSSLKDSQIVTSFAQGDRLRHYLYIDTGDVDANADVHEFLRERREQVETAYGRSLTWV